MAGRPRQKSPNAAVATDNAPADLWSAYWSEAGIHGCTEQFPRDVHRQIVERWRTSFALLSKGSTLLDVACGRGAVLSAARDAGAFARGAIAVGVDLAKKPTVADDGFDTRGGIDAAELPFADRSFTLVTSQFGIEYAGLDRALDEAARVAAERLVLLTHAAEGVVARQAAEQVAHAAALLEERHLAARLHVAIDEGDPGRFDAILQDIATLLRGATNQGLLEQIYSSAAELQRLVRVVPKSELVAAVDFMIAQIGGHRRRMAALVCAAPLRARIDSGAARLRARGFAAPVTEGRSPRGDLVGYWLDAKRAGDL